MFDALDHGAGGRIEVVPAAVVVVLALDQVAALIKTNPYAFLAVVRVVGDEHILTDGHDAVLVIVLLVLIPAVFRFGRLGWLSGLGRLIRVGRRTGIDRFAGSLLGLRFDIRLRFGSGLCGGAGLGRLRA